MFFPWGRFLPEFRNVGSGKKDDGRVGINRPDNTAGRRLVRFGDPPKKLFQNTLQFFPNLLLKLRATGLNLE